MPTLSRWWSWTGPSEQPAATKSDSLDAMRAAREALGRDHLAQPRAAGIARRSRCG
jgi:hypothetical protein